MIKSYSKNINIFAKVLVFAVTIIIAVLYISYLTNQADSELREELLIQTKILGHSLDINLILELKGTIDDLENPSYILLQQQLTRIFAAYNKFTYIYLMARNDNTKEIFYLVDGYNESAIESDPELPGSIYSEATDELIKIFDNGLPFVEGPVEDEWGVWVSALTPFFHPQTGKVIAVLGIDIETSDWKWKIISRISSTVALMILLLIMIYFVFIILQSKKELSNREIRISKQRSAITAFLLDKDFSELELDEIFNNLAKITGKTLNTDLTSIWLISNNNSKLINKTIYNNQLDTFNKGFELNLSDIPHYMNSIKGKQVLTVYDTKNNPSVNDLMDIHIIKNNISSLMNACILIDGKLIGVLCVEVIGKKRVWETDEENFLSTIATVTSQLISQNKQKLTEKNLLETHSILTTTLESMTDGFISLDLQYRLLYTNSQASQLIFDNINVYLGQVVWNIVSKDLISDFKKHLDNNLNNQNTTNFTIYSDSRKKWFDFRAYRSNQGLSIFFQDITDKKQAEKAILESQRLSAVGEMSNAISHDFNNYLQIILGSIEVVEKKHVFSDEIKDYFEKIRLATIDATTRVKLLQRFSGTSSVKSEYSPININDVVKDAILQTQPLWKNTSESKGISINIKVNEGLVKNLSGNKSELRTVVFNLIKNSIEAMPKGGTITFNTGMIDNFVYLQVSDDGIGIDLSNQEKIFQPLFTTKGFELGKGFGLTSSYSIIKEHNGSLKILESIAGKGTTIEILLPVTEEKIPEETEKTMSGSDKKIKILWVDDDSMIRHIVSDMCDILGYAVTVAENAYEALDLLNNESFHFIFTDIGMPGMNGWQLLDKIDELHKGKFVVGVVSGWGDQIKDEEKEAHVFNFIFTKPIKMKDLKKNIDYLISTNKINIE